MHLVNLNAKLAVPPSIDDSLSSSDVTVREHSTVTLTCNAAGTSPLTVRWRREDGNLISINRTYAGKKTGWGRFVSARSIIDEKHIIGKLLISTRMGWDASDNESRGPRGHGRLLVYRQQRSAAHGQQANIRLR